MKPDVGSPVEVTVGPVGEGGFVIRLGSEAVWRFAGAPPLTTEAEQGVVLHMYLERPSLEDDG